MSKQQMEFLKKFSACDISDALLAVEEVEEGVVRRGGFLGDLVLRVPADGSGLPPLIAPAFTVQFQPKSKKDGDDCLPRLEASNIPTDAQWSDLTLPQTIVVLQQPLGQMNAAVGGIHVLRIAKRGALGLVVEGRIRDLGEMQEIGLTVWSAETSTVGAGAQCKPYATQVPVTIGDVQVKPGDLILADPSEGVVRIPLEVVEGVIVWLQKRGDREEKIQDMIRDGFSVEEAFEKCR